MEIKNTYLMWIGKDHYPTIQSYTDEAEALGISKRLPNAAVAQALAKPGTVVFLAHDEGNYEECPDCSGKLENPEVRKLSLTFLRACEDTVKRQAELDALKVAPDAHLIAPELRKKALHHAEVLYKNALKRQIEARQNLEDQPEVITGGTGGTVIVDGEVWDYRRYNYWLHQPGKWNPDDHKVDTTGMCKACGGTGRVPVGQVFGLFVPQQLEYILKSEDNAEVKAKMEAMGIKVVETKVIKAETKRGCGFRKPGGVYAVTKEGEEDKEATKAAIEALVKGGHITPEGADVKGGFIKLLTPIDIPATKRFRGIRRWALDPRVEAEAELIAEAI